MVRWARMAVLAAALLGGCAAKPETLTADPATAQSVIAGARGGDTITLAPGRYDKITLKDRDWDKPVIVEAAAATLVGVELTAVNNLTWRGGIFDGGEAQKYGFFVRQSHQIAISGTQMSHFLRAGIVIDRTDGVRLLRNVFSNMGSDGIDMALSHRILVDGNDCHDFVPTPGAHPDCIQAWSRPTNPPVSDLIIVRNKMVGLMQGISLFNHMRDGVDDGGFDRVLIAHNDIRIGYPNGISAFDCRSCIIRDNRVDSSSGSGYKTVIREDRSNALLCSNVVPMAPASGGYGRCRASDTDPTPAEER